MVADDVIELARIEPLLVEKKRKMRRIVRMQKTFKVRGPYIDGQGCIV